MVYWITGKAMSGKTTLAIRLKKELELSGKQVVILDGENIREYFPTGYSDEERLNHILFICKLACILEDQGIVPILALVSPKKEFRMEGRKLFRNSMLIYMKGGYLWKGTNYEIPDDEEFTLNTDR